MIIIKIIIIMIIIIIIMKNNEESHSSARELLHWNANLGFPRFSATRLSCFALLFSIKKGEYKPNFYVFVWLKYFGYKVRRSQIL